MKNYNIAAKKKGGDVIFLRKIVRGGADQSYGIEVAKLAGVPERVITRAREILQELEEQSAGRSGAYAPAAARPEENREDAAAQKAAETLRNTAVETLTPIEAMNLLYQLRNSLLDDGKDET